ncbi:Synapsin, ATP binding domain containing protein [Histomonas meleagridis]|nr:Synapsin, ATP binding domain containing protein [Histomonas meleagridis]
MQGKKRLPTVLVISGPKENWYDVCQECADVFTVEQAMWEDISLTSFPDSVNVTLMPSKYPISEKQKMKRVITPSVVLIRMLFRYVGPLGTSNDYRNILYGFYHAGVTLINPFYATLCDLDRPIMMGRLRDLQRKLGHDTFPVIPQTYYSDYTEMVFTPSLPFVVKVSYPHAGYGKMKITQNDQFQDLKTVVAINNHYSAAEPLIESEYEVRIAFIAPDYISAHKRVSQGWKVNHGMPNVREDIEVTPKYRMWVEEIRKEFPDMETFSIDTIIGKDGKEYILETNGSAQGFTPEHKDEALAKLRDLILSKFQKKRKM